MKYTKVIIVTLFCIAFVFGSVSPTFGQGGAPQYAGLNYQKIALLKWYTANQSASFKVGSNPNGVAFDGANVWVANFGTDDSPGNTVTKLRAADGATMGTFTVGTGPYLMAFDGANIWVTNAGTSASPGNTVTKLRASDGATLGTFTVGTVPHGIAFDGANIWVANYGTSDSPGRTVTKLRASDGAFLGTFTIGEKETAYTDSLAFDGTYIWVANWNESQLWLIRVSDGTVVPGPVGIFEPRSFVFDGANMWVSGGGDKVVVKIPTSGHGGGCVAYQVFSHSMAFDGVNIWLAGGTRLRASDCAKLQSVNYGTGGVAFDGANIWMAGCGDGVCKF